MTINLCMQSLCHKQNIGKEFYVQGSEKHGIKNHQTSCQFS